MGYQDSGGPRVHTGQFFTSNYTQGEAFIQWFRAQMENAGWTAERILAHVKFTVTFAIVAGDTITLAGNTFNFVASGSAPFNVVVVPGNSLATLVNLAARAEIDLQWEDYEITGTTVPSIEWTIPDPHDPPQENYTANIEAFSVTPAGTTGVFDYNPESITGFGRSWGGGFRFTSAPNELGTYCVFDLLTINSRVCDVQIVSLDEVANFNGLQVASNWFLLACPYQFFLYVPSALGAGNFMMVSLLAPITSVPLSAIFMCGPFNPILPFGGARTNLSEIGTLYYVNAGAGYAAAGLDDGQQPCFVFPGYGFGVSALQKLINHFAFEDIKREDGSAFPYEPFIAACLSTPGGGGPGSDRVYIIGQLWDAIISSNYESPDSVAEINGKDAIVMMSQGGTNETSRGSLVIQTED